MSRHRPPCSLIVLSMWCAAVNAVPLHVDDYVRFGPISVFGALTMAQLAVFTVAAMRLRAYPPTLLRRLLPFAALIAWAVTRSATGIGFNGVQNLIVYLLFAVGTLFAGTVSETDPRRAERMVTLAMRSLDFVVLPFIAWMFVTRGFPLNADWWPIQPRALAITGLFALAWHVARWRPGAWGPALWAFLWLAAIAVSLSRTATVVAVVVAGLALAIRLRARPVRLIATAGTLIALAVTLLSVGSYTSVLTERFFSGDTSLEVGGFAVNAMGRAEIWQAVIDSAWRHPMAGGGLGSSQEAVAPFGESVNHPHNDYLRIWHDLGLPGVMFLAWWLVDWLAVFGAAAWRSARWDAAAVGPQRDEAVMPLVAFLSVFAFVCMAITDNPIVYPPVMGPLAVLAGAAFATLDRMAPPDMSPSRSPRRVHSPGSQS